MQANRVACCIENRFYDGLFGYPSSPTETYSVSKLWAIYRARF